MKCLLLKFLRKSQISSANLLSEPFANGKLKDSAISVDKKVTYRNVLVLVLETKFSIKKFKKTLKNFIKKRKKIQSHHLIKEEAV